MDYILFCCGLALILISTICTARWRSGESKYPWLCFALASAFLGIMYWLYLFAYSLGDNNILSALRALFCVSACVFIMEFARRSSMVMFGKTIGAWVYMPLSIAAIIASFKGLNNLASFGAYTFGLVGSLGSSFILIAYAKTKAGTEKWSLIVFSTFLASLSVILVFIVPEATIYQTYLESSSIFHQANYTAYLPQTIVICLGAVFLWIFHQSSCKDAIISSARVKSGIITVIAVAVILAIGWKATAIRTHASMHDQSNRLLTIAKTSTTAIDPKLVKSLTGSQSDKNNAAFAHIHKQMEKIKQANSSCRHAYLIGRKDDGGIIFLVDAENPDSKDYSSPGDVYYEASDDLRQGFVDGNARFEGPVSDRWGVWVSALAPIKDPANGKIIALFGMNFNAYDWQRAQSESRLPVILVTLLLSLLIIVFAFITQVIKESAIRMENSQRKHRELVEGSANCITYIDMDGRYTSINESGLKAMGWEKDDVIGLRFLDTWSKEGRLVAQNAFELVQSGISCSFEADCIISLDNTISWYVVMSPVNDYAGEIISVAAIWTNITERKEAENAVKRYRFLASNASDFILFVRRDGKIIEANNAAAKAYGYDRSQLLRLNIEDLQDSENTLSSIDMMDRSEYDALIETVHRRKDGSVFPVEISATTAIMGQEIVLLCIIRDITDRIKAEAELEMRLKYETALNVCSQILLGNDDSSDQLTRALQHLLVELNVSRIYMLETFNDPDDGVCMRQVMEVCNEGIDSQIDNPVLQHIACEGHLKRWYECLSAGMPIKGIAKDFPEDERKLLEEQGVLSLLVLPIKINGTFHGVICFDDYVREYEWSSRDIALLSTAAHMIAVHIDRKRTEAYLHMQTSAMNAASDEIIITNAKGEITFVNPAFIQQTGYTFKEVLGKIPDFLQPNNNILSLNQSIHTAITSGHTWNGEITDRRKDGSLVIEDTTITPIKNENGEIESFVSIRRNIAEKKMYERKLDHIAHHDPLTGLPNRLLFAGRLNRSLAEARDKKSMLGVMFLDLDRFKMINETLGHKVGDLLLGEVAGRLTKLLRGVDTIARMGGDEFILILKNIKDNNDTVKVAKRIMDAFNKPFILDEHELFVTASIGISIYPTDGADVESLVKNADSAMYCAKERGRNNYYIYDDSLNATSLEHIKLENSLRKALENEELQVYYQPNVEIRTGEIRGVEALARWCHRSFGMVAPSQFIPIAEEAGMIGQITELVMFEACKQNKIWQDAGLDPFSVAVNISAKQIQNEDLVNLVKRALDYSGLDPQYLGLELTESALMRNSDYASRILRKLKDMGVRIAVDDFGTGYSSLSYLKRLPLDVVKIDQSFVKDITTNIDDAAIASAVVAMAHSLKLTVIAEGVETIEQLDYLRSLKCDQVQGYFISKPVPGGELTRAFFENADRKLGTFPFAA